MLRSKLEVDDGIINSPYLLYKGCAPARLRELVDAGPVLRWVLGSG